MSSQFDPRRGARSLHVFLALVGSCALARAQAAEYVEGGVLSWPWVWRETPTSPHYRLWTAEDGGRIRFVDIPNISQAATASWRVFQKMSPPTNKILRDVTVLPDAQNGVSVGDGASWYWTNEASVANGKWFASTLSIPSQWPSDAKLWDVALLSTSLAYVVGDAGVLASTTTPLSSNVSLTPVSVAGGAPTERLIGIEFVPGSMTAAAVGTAVFDDVNDVLIGGGYYTIDGVNWSPSTFEMRDPSGAIVPPTQDVELFKLAWEPNTNPGAAVGYAVGGFGSGVGFIFRTDNGGQLWRQEHHECSATPPSANCPAGSCSVPAPSCPAGQSASSRPKEYGAFNGLYGVSTYVSGASAVGYGGQILRRPNNMVGPVAVWREVTNRCTQTTTPLWGVHSDGLNTGILCGSPEQIRISRDRGVTWRNMLLDDERRRFALAYAPTSGAQGAVWTGGENARIQVSYDQGASWEVQTDIPAGPEHHRDILALAVHRDGDADAANDIGIAVGLPAELVSMGGLTSTIYTTTNGGQSCGWSRASASGLAENETWKDVACAGVTSSGAVSFWLVGESGRVARALCSAGTWSFVEVLAPSSITWRAVAFRSANVGWIVGVDSATGLGAAQGTINGESASPSFQPALRGLGVAALNAVAVDATNCIAAGDDPTKVLWIDPNGSPTNFVLFPAQPSTSASLDCAALVTSTSGGIAVAVVGGAGGEMHSAVVQASTFWSPRTSATSLNLRQMAFADDSDGFILATSGIDELHGGGISAVVRLR